MKKVLLLLGLMSAVLARAQVSVEVLLDQDQFLPGEPIVAGVRISNRSGETLHLGDDNSWLSFSIESRSGQIVPRLGDIPVRTPFDVESSRRATKRVDLAPYFALTDQGRYTVTATVHINELGRDVVSPGKGFNVIEGARLWEQDFGVPVKGGGAPEVRKYILQQANYLKSQLRLYLRITDATGDKVIRTTPVGVALSFSNPDPRIDKDGNLHVLYQSWARAFTYVVFNPDGELVRRDIYDFEQSRPHFIVDKDGTLSVLGGIRRVTQNDVSASKEQPTAGVPPADP